MSDWEDTGIHLKTNWNDKEAHLPWNRCRFVSQTRGIFNMHRVGKFRDFLRCNWINQNLIPQQYFTISYHPLPPPSSSSQNYPVITWLWGEVFSEIEQFLVKHQRMCDERKLKNLSKQLFSRKIQDSVVVHNEEEQDQQHKNLETTTGTVCVKRFPWIAADLYTFTPPSHFGGSIHPGK